MSGLGSLILHLFVVVLLALVPWGTASEPQGNEGQSVVIGQLDRQPLVRRDKSWDTSALETQNRASFQPQNQEIQPLSSEKSWTAADMSVQLPSVASGLDRSVNFDAVASDSASHSGAQDFGELITQLKRDGLDIVITFDSTGSMDSEIRQVKSKIERIGGALFQLVPKTRLSICTYRDEGDQYVVKGLKLTDSLSKVSEYLDSISASGGGDVPEAVDQGLTWSINENSFRPRARKVILLFGDAPPHANRQKACLTQAANFRRQQSGIVSTVTCHSEQRLTEFAEIAQIGGGEAFLTRNDREIMTQLMVLVFGSQHREKVVQALDLLNQ